MAGETHASDFSCSQCKGRKVKCDRTRPVCRRCIKDGATCEYPTARKRPVQLPSRSARFHVLENRVVELEDKLRQKESQDRGAPTPESLPGAGSLVGTGRFEKLPPQHQIEELTNLFFSKLNTEYPMIHPTRYLNSLYRPPHMQPPMCLQYIIMAMAAHASPIYSELAEPFYRRARYYMESDEMRGDGDHITLAHCQCWTLTSLFEATQLWFSRGSISAARAVRLSQVLGLQSVDGPPSMNQTLLPPRDWCEREERRRTFWTCFTIDRGTSYTGAWPTLIDVSQIQTHLPCSDLAFNTGVEESSMTLDDAMMYEATNRSPFASKVIAMHLLQESFQLSHPKPGLGDMEDSFFWNSHEHLHQSLDIALSTLPYSDISISTKLQLHTATISLCRAVVGRKGFSGVAPSLDFRALPAAQEIATTIALAPDINTHFQNPFVSFAAFMAASVFCKRYMETQDETCYRRLLALLDVMISVGLQNPGFPATLAIQLARELETTGIDPLAMEKVRPLTDKFEKGTPDLGKEDKSTGMILFCPMKH